MPPHRLLLVVLNAAAIPLYGGITVETSPATNTLISNPDVLDGAGNGDGSSRFAFTSTTSDYFTKGESFTLAESADLSAITIRVDENATINDGVSDLTLRVYNLSGVPDDTQGTGQAAIGAALVSQTETLPAIAAGDYLTVTLETPLNLTAKKKFPAVPIDIKSGKATPNSHSPCLERPTRLNGGTLTNKKSS